MSRIDDELEQAVQDSGQNPAPGSAAQTTAEGRVSLPEGRVPQGRAAMAAEEPQKKNWGLLAGLGALMTGILVLVFSSSEDASVYAYTVDDLTAQASELSGRQVRVTGTLVSGTLYRRDRPCEYQFNLQPSRVPAAAAGVSAASLAPAAEKNVEYLKVSFPQCVVPDTFRDVKGVEVEVTAEGRVNEDGSLEASKVFAKCPSKYEMRESATETGKRPDHAGGAPQPEFVGVKKLEDIR
jgi:cytochrome c-type biogenesis protein CcmE